jgi:hypothetical protein
VFEEWDCEELCKRRDEMKILKDAIDKCKENQLDGLSLLEFSYNDLVNDMQSSTISWCIQCLLFGGIMRE